MAERFTNTARDFFKELGDWGYSADFGAYPATADDRTQSYLRVFIRENFIN